MLDGKLYPVAPKSDSREASLTCPEILNRSHKVLQSAAKDLHDRCETGSSSLEVKNWSVTGEVYDVFNLQI